MKHSPALLATLALLAVTVSAPAPAADYMGAITSDVYQTTGTPAEIARRAKLCMSQYLAPGQVDAPLFVSDDVESGTLVARSAVEYGDGLIRWKIRTTFTFEARDGRFRIEQSNLERFNDQFNVGWKPIGKWAGSGWKKAEAAFVASAGVVAQCVMTPAAADDW